MNNSAIHDSGKSGNNSSFRVSLVIPTYNSSRTLPACLTAIRTQNYPRQQIEIVIADAGSTDQTIEIAHRYEVDKIVPNPLKTGEAGKSAGIKAASGALIALVDSDNILDSPDWLANMVKPFDDPNIVAAEPLWYTRRPTDPATTRYFAMLGMNDPLCLFLGNYDRMSAVTGRWTDLDVITQDRGDFLELTLRADRLPTIGANGFVIRRSLLDEVKWEPYFFDIDIMHQAVASGHNRVAKVRCGIVHLFCNTLSDFARKQDRRIRDFLFFSGTQERTYPWDQQKRIGLIRFCLATLFVAPLLVQMARGWRRQPDRAWWLHIPVCWITLWIYGLATIQKALGVTPAAKTRRGWKQ
jgi:glycosyltransferase involved in cell wall biosynthesis